MIGTPELDPVDRLRRDAGRLLVSRAIDRDDWISQAVLDIAAGSKIDWTPADWQILVRDLKAGRLNISDWLDLTPDAVSFPQLPRPKPKR